MPEEDSTILWSLRLYVLESWVLELFSSVKKGPLIKQEARTEVPIWKAGKLYRLEAVKVVHILNLTWTLPCLRKDYLKKLEDYLAHLIGHGKILHVHMFSNSFIQRKHFVYFIWKRWKRLDFYASLVI